MQYFSTNRECRRYYKIYNQYFKSTKYLNYSLLNGNKFGNYQYVEEYYFINSYKDCQSFHDPKLFHNTKGPAYTKMYKNGSKCTRFYINGFRYKKLTTFSM